MSSELSAEALGEEAGVDHEKHNRAIDDATIERTAAALRAHGFHVHVVDGKPAALDALKTIIPEGSEVMNGSSTTLIEIGFTQLLADGPWKSVHAKINAENDPVLRSDLRRLAVASEWFVASVNAVAETGELVAADRSGSRVGAMPFAAKNVAIVVGVNKIVPTVQDGLDRITNYAFPLERVRAKKAYGMESAMSKILIYARETNERRTHVVLVRERLGY